MSVTVINPLLNLVFYQRKKSPHAERMNIKRSFIKPLTSKRNFRFRSRVSSAQRRQCNFTALNMLINGGRERPTN